MQVVWWSTLSDKYQAEMQAQAGVFGGEYGEQVQTDFRCACGAVSVMNTRGVVDFSVLPAVGCCCSSA